MKTVDLFRSESSLDCVLYWPYIMYIYLYIAWHIFNMALYGECSIVSHANYNFFICQILEHMYLFCVFQVEELPVIQLR